MIDVKTQCCEPWIQRTPHTMTPWIQRTFAMATTLTNSSEPRPLQRIPGHIKPLSRIQKGSFYPGYTVPSFSTCTLCSLQIIVARGDLASASFLAEISVESPRKLFIFII